jgi:hypothetical protein
MCHEGRGQSLGRLESRFNGSLELRSVDLGRQRFVRQHIAHRPRLSARIGQLALHGYWREMDRALTEWERHAALAAKIFGCSCYPVGERDVHRLIDAVDYGLTKLYPYLIRRCEKSDVLSSKIWFETSHEHR